jgi:hypothetical protein
MNVFVRRWILGELEMVELRNKVISIPAGGGYKSLLIGKRKPVYVFDIDVGEYENTAVCEKNRLHRESLFDSVFYSISIWGKKGMTILYIIMFGGKQ